jgi:hypothetical protein
MVRLCNLLHGAGVHIVLCAGRPERYRPQTVTGLAREGVRYDELRLRHDGDRRSDTIAKPCKALAQSFRPGHEA